MPNRLSFDSKRTKRLRIAYEKATKDAKESFLFDGHEFLTDYAKYVLAYLEDRLLKQARGE